MKKSIVRFLIWALFKAFSRVFWFFQGRASFPKTQQKNSAQNGGCFWTLKSEKCKKTQKKLFFYFIVPNRAKYHTDHLYTYKGYILTVSFTEKREKVENRQVVKKTAEISSKHSDVGTHFKQLKKLLKKSSVRIWIRCLEV